MKINVRTHHVSITPSLKEYAQKKMEKLAKYSDKIIDISIELDTKNISNENQRQIVQVTVKVPGTIIRAEESSADMYASLDLVSDKLEKQLRKYKDKLKEHKKIPMKRSIISNNYKATKKQTIDNAPLYIPKPMDPEDAAEILQETAQAFLMFRNIQTEKINVIHAIGNNTYELIEP